MVIHPQEFNRAQLTHSLGWNTLYLVGVHGMPAFQCATLGFQGKALMFGQPIAVWQNIELL